LGQKIKLSGFNRLAVAGFFCVAVLAVVMGFALSTLLTRAVSEWEGESTAAFARHQFEGADLDPLFAAPPTPETANRWQEELPRLFASLPGVVGCKVWDRGGTVLWSEDAAAIGQRSPENQNLQAALAGKVVAQVRELIAEGRGPGGEEFQTLAQVYVPIFSKGTKELLGVLEIYRVPTHLFATLRRGLVVIWAISLAGGAVLSLILFSLAKRVQGRGARDDRRRTEQIRAEVETRFGFFPPFFEPALEAPAVLENLWQQTLSAYVENPLPALFKEKLFAYLSRYCAVPYCIVCHSCALRPMGMPAGEVLALIESPPPTESDILDQLTVLSAQRAPLAAWPDPGSRLEKTLMSGSIFLFLHPDQAEHCQAEMRRLLGPALYPRLAEFLAYVKTCHLWVEAHPELAYEADQRAREHLGPLLDQEPRLSHFFRDYGERVKRERRRREGEQQTE
jgi:hypothetical protein